MSMALQYPFPAQQSKPLPQPPQGQQAYNSNPQATQNYSVPYSSAAPYYSYSQPPSYSNTVPRQLPSVPSQYTSTQNQYPAAHGTYPAHTSSQVYIAPSQQHQQLPQQHQQSQTSTDYYSNAAASAALPQTMSYGHANYPVATTQSYSPTVHQYSTHSTSDSHTNHNAYNHYPTTYTNPPTSSAQPDNAISYTYQPQQQYIPYQSVNTPPSYTQNPASPHNVNGYSNAPQYSAAAYANSSTATAFQNSPYTQIPSSQPTISYNIQQAPPLSQNPAPSIHTNNTNNLPPSTSTSYSNLPAASHNPQTSPVYPHNSPLNSATIPHSSTPEVSLPNTNNNKATPPTISLPSDNNSPPAIPSNPPPVICIPNSPPPAISITAEADDSVEASADAPQISILKDESVPQISISGEEPEKPLNAMEVTKVEKENDGVDGEENYTNGVYHTDPEDVSHPTLASISSSLVCAGCLLPINGRTLSAMSRRWHPECFVCSKPECDENLEHLEFHESDGRPWCHLHFHEEFSKKCHQCKTPIVDETFVTIDDPALGGKRVYHELHFFCAECGDPFVDPKSLQPVQHNNVYDEDRSSDDMFRHTKPYVAHNGHPYCEQCHINLRKPKCAKCRKPIQDDVLQALGKRYHEECFTCNRCHNVFEDSSFLVWQDSPFCEACYKVILINEMN